MLLFSKVLISIHRDVSDFIVIFFLVTSCLWLKKVAHQKERQLLSNSHSRYTVSHIILRQGFQEISIENTWKN